MKSNELRKKVNEKKLLIHQSFQKKVQSEPIVQAKIEEKEKEKEEEKVIIKEDTELNIENKESKNKNKK